MGSDRSMAPAAKAPAATATMTAQARPAAGGTRDPRDRDNAALSGAASSGDGIAQWLDSDSRPLAPDLRAQMQGRFGYDFSNVRIHADDRAGAMADTIGANAFTVENHIVFGTGKFAPHRPDGLRLIAHELTHVVQQQPLPRDRPLPDRFGELVVSHANDDGEREAAHVAERIVRGETVSVQQRASGVLQADLAGIGVGALIGGAVGAIAGGLIGGAAGAAIGGGLGIVAGGVIGGLATATGNSIFPSYSEIVGDSAVQTAITSAWSSTEAAANATSRREEGFWIRLNKGTGRYEFTSTVLGPSIGPTATGSVVLGARPADTNPNTATATYTVASFHTHTPTAFRTVGRGVGPSDADNTADTSDDVVGVIYDYVESPAGSGNVPAGHPIGSPAQPYHSGPDRRQRI